jgi:hypothetical protein
MAKSCDQLLIDIGVLREIRPLQSSMLLGAVKILWSSPVLTGISRSRPLSGTGVPGNDRSVAGRPCCSFAVFGHGPTHGKHARVATSSRLFTSPTPSS